MDNFEIEFFKHFGKAFLIQTPIAAAIGYSAGLLLDYLGFGFTITL
tara:strand:+ start:3974 stop:4111 length:138 start_codon:yes stop_codon:yes gene_type:complete